MAIKNTKERIIEVAKNLFLKKGVDKTSVRDIAKTAGINIAALNYHFSSKESLFDMIFDRILSSAVPSLPEILDADLEINVKIKKYVETYIDILIKNPQLTYFVISVLNRDPEKITRLKAFQLLYTTEKFTRQLMDEAEKGNIRRVHPHQFFVDMLAMINFPFAIQDALKQAFEIDDKGFEDFVFQRKRMVVETLLLTLNPV